MEKLQLHNSHSPLFALLLFLLHFSSLQFLSLAYAPPNNYFINCGSASNVNTALRNFVGDSNSSDSISASFSLSGQSSTVNQSSGASPLYQTARIFRHNSSYEFNIEDPGTYFVRFHFFAFSSPTTQTDLSTSLFDVLTSEFSLLLSFTPGNNSNSPILKEFLLSINQEKFRIYFVPRGSSFAFINAIEVFLAPLDLIPDEASHVSPVGLSNNSYTGVLSKSLQSIYRINVGGPALTPDNDKLWRNWVPDDGYIYNPGAAVDTSDFGRPNYQGSITEFTAPDLIYQTAKQMNSSAQTTHSNITWSFNVSKSAVHLVRFHFCDIISSTSLGTLKFNLYIYGNFSFKIDSYDYADLLDVPFYVDFVVDSDESGLMNISIGPLVDSDLKTAYLNGLEIKEILMNNSGSVPIVIAHKNNHVFLVVGSVIGGLVLICILVAVLLLVFKSRKPEPVENSSLPSHLCRYFSLTEIRAATNNFDDAFIVGVGGFGNVYKGYIDDAATPVAIKRLNPGSKQGANEFKTEIEMLSQLRHLNLVYLIGYCDDGCEMILIYDYMARGTLRDHLYNTDNPPLLWKQRLEICIGAAHGLNYLHTGAKQTIIHRDVKTTNILLDENWVAKVSDFGLSKLGPTGMLKSHVSTVVKGSFGYLDPEYYRRQRLTEKSDVYSFGVVLCEVLCARPPIIRTTGTAVGLARWARESYLNGKVEQMVDPSLKGEIKIRSLKKFVEIAVNCLLDDGIERPSMNDVVWGLEFALQLQESAGEDAGLLDVAETEAMDNEKAHFPKSMLDDSDDMSSRSRQVSSTNSNSRVTEGTISGSLGSNLNLGLKMPFAEIQFVTNNFDKKLLIGKDGFSNVYRGTFRDGKKVAVKQNEPGDNQGLPEFHTEIMVLSKIRHRNLVQLIGYCDERFEMILVYEFMEKGTLRDHLYASDKPPLSWKQRLEICIGAARGLQYLHKGSAGGTIHRDVKSTNILLDENHVAKVADFGISKTVPLDETHASTVVKGTFGYLDPEYFKTQQLTEKSDVYSFGVVLLEVLCARPPVDPTLQREQVNLAEWAMICKKKGLLEEIVDPSVKGQIDPNSLRKFIETTEKCLQDCGADRPNMADVIWDLEYALQIQQNAMQKEPHEDSTTNSSAALVMPKSQCSVVSFN